ncbi:MAG: hypothetical protein R2838_05400 [Caldilineaceae bacterium]
MNCFFNLLSHAYYITTVVYDRLPIFTQPSTIIPLFDSLNYYRAQVRMRLLTQAVMPEHVHLLLWLPKRRHGNIHAWLQDIYRKRIIQLWQSAEQRRDWLAALAYAGMVKQDGARTRYGRTISGKSVLSVIGLCARS